MQRRYEIFAQTVRLDLILHRAEKLQERRAANEDEAVALCMDLGPYPTMEAVYEKLRTEMPDALDVLGAPEIFGVAVDVTLEHGGSNMRELAEVLDEKMDEPEGARQRVVEHFGEAGRWISKLAQDSQDWREG